VAWAGLESIATCWAVASVLFFLLAGLGDPVGMLAGQRTDAETLNSIRTELGLDRSLLHQYLVFLERLSPVGLNKESTLDTRPTVISALPIPGTGWGVSLQVPDTGLSYRTREPSVDIYLRHLPATALLTCTALGGALLLGVGLGFGWGWGWPRAAAWGKFMASVGLSVPGYLMGMILAWLLAVEAGAWTGLPLSGYVWQAGFGATLYTLDLRCLLLPALAVGIRPCALFFLLAAERAETIYRADFVRTARAKGLPETVVRFRHGLRAVCTPILTAAGGWLAGLLGGSFFVEALFDWPGIGKLTLDALQSGDYPVALGACTYTAFLFWAINQGTQLVARQLDPRL
jgi:peptide/nickel transport system permease protein